MSKLRIAHQSVSLSQLQQSSEAPLGRKWREMGIGLIRIMSLVEPSGFVGRLMVRYVSVEASRSLDMDTMLARG